MSSSPTSTTGTSGSGRRGVIVAAVPTVVLLVVAAVALSLGFRGDGRHDSPPASVAASATSVGQSPSMPDGASSNSSQGQANSSSTPSAALADQPSFGDFLPASQPTRIAIPAIGLTSSTFVDLAVQRNGTLSVPGTENEVGLYQAGPTPGQLGPAVLGAHVDSPDGRKGIFWNLGKVRPGDTVDITRTDRTTAVFTVDRVKAYPKAEFPTDLVYKGDFTRSEIRLVTCGGPVDSRNEYRDNVVVFGHLTGTR
ncbi:class F sortase [Humibacillus xanthopallidus]|uniref:Sortase family protein n=1 Tax=Humibacillus xanthopallidus TaxID=412689 RepID=A0A543H8J4_9MICO|nr:class F sortase [Humibacillus xanthopallidus]TQM54569.1 sortase family protein [Humibacillus xanthopallidus]